MGWADDLIDGAINGVRFEWRAIEGRGGPKQVIKQLATSRRPRVDVLGPGNHRFSVEAFVIGDDWQDRRDALMGVLDTPGELSFAHPSLGNLRVALTGDGYTWRESVDEGRVVRFTFVLEEIEGDEYPLIRDEIQAAGTAADLALELLAGDFSQRFSLGDFAGKVKGAINEASMALLAAEGRVRGALGAVTSTGLAAEDFADRAGALLRTPDLLVDSLISASLGVWAAVSEIDVDVQDRAERISGAFVGALDLVFSSETTAGTGTTVQAQLEIDNSRAIEDALRIATVASSAAAAVELPFGTKRDLDRVRNAVISRLTEVIEGDGVADQIFASLRDLRAQTAAALGQVREELPVVTTYTPPAQIPALVLAFDLYGDATREDEIIARNGIRDPGFVAGGEPLEVIRG